MISGWRGHTTTGEERRPTSPTDAGLPVKRLANALAMLSIHSAEILKRDRLSSGVVLRRHPDPRLQNPHSPWPNGSPSSSCGFIEGCENLDILSALVALNQSRTVLENRTHDVGQVIDMAVAVDVRDILRRPGADVLVLRQLRIELPVFDPIDGIAPEYD